MSIERGVFPQRCSPYLGFETLTSGFGWSDTAYAHLCFDVQVHYAGAHQDLSDECFDEEKEVALMCDLCYERLRNNLAVIEMQKHSSVHSASYGLFASAGLFRSCAKKKAKDKQRKHFT